MLPLHECRRTVLPFTVVTTVAQLFDVDADDEPPMLFEPLPTPRNRSERSNSSNAM